MAFKRTMKEGDGIAIGDKCVVVVGRIKGRTARVLVQTVETVAHTGNVTPAQKHRIKRLAEEAVAEASEGRKADNKKKAKKK